MNEYNNNNHDDDVAKGPLSLFELMNIRRMISDYIYRRRMRKTLKIWIYTLGTVVSMTAGVLAAWKEIAARFWK